MLKSRRIVNAAVLFLIVTAMASVWLVVSIVKITNARDELVSYVVDGTAGFRSMGSVAPGKSVYLYRFRISEGGISIRAQSDRTNDCKANVYVVPPIGGKCDMHFKRDASECRCRLGI